MIIQERHEIRLVIATYDRRYIDYLNNKQSDNSDVSLMEMCEVYSWDITKQNNMKSFGPVLLALALQNGKLEY